MLVAPFKDWNRAGILIIFAPRDQKAVLEVTKRLQLVPATKSGSVSVADFVDAIRFSLATAMELSQVRTPPPHLSAPNRFTRGGTPHDTSIVGVAPHTRARLPASPDRWCDAFLTRSALYRLPQSIHTPTIPRPT